jgi:hypothetical protein
MDEKLRSKMEVEASAKLEWGYSTAEVVAALVELGASQIEAEQLVRHVSAHRARSLVRRDMLIGAVGLGMMLFGCAMIGLSKMIKASQPTIRHTRGDIAQLSIFPIILGMAVIGYSVGSLLYTLKRRRW